MGVRFSLGLHEIFPRAKRLAVNFSAPPTAGPLLPNKPVRATIEYTMAEEEKKNVFEPVTWRAAEREFTEKSLEWYLIVGAVALVLIVTALVLENYLFALFLVLAAVVVYFLSRRHPRVVDFRIDEHGIMMGSTEWHYSEIEAFTIHQRFGRLDHIVLRRKISMNPFVHIPIDGHLAVQARAALAERLPEFEFEETLLDMLADWLGF
jgi:hypothetical protein